MHRWHISLLLVLLITLSAAVSGRAQTCPPLAAGTGFSTLNESQWLEVSADQGNPGAQETLALRNYFGIGRSCNRDRAMALIQQSAKSGHRSALALLENTRGMERGGRQEAVQWLLLAADKGIAAAHELLGIEHLKGEILTRDPVKAAEFFQFAAPLGYHASQYHLGMFYLEGVDRTRDLNEAMEWLRQAAEAGHPAACFEVGRLYLEGGDLPVDDREAEKWLRRASGLDGRADHYLWKMAKDGRITSARKEDVAKWLESAARSGEAEAQFVLGNTLRNGEVLSWHITDHCRRRMALYWYRQAAERDHLPAGAALARLYLHGPGDDLVEGCRWAETMVRQGRKSAEALRQACPQP